jgi:hypothetical protein
MKFNLKVLPTMMQSPHIYREDGSNYTDVMLHQFYTAKKLNIVSVDAYF